MCCIRISYPSSSPRTAADVSLALFRTVAGSNGLASLARRFPPQATAGGVGRGIVAKWDCFRSKPAWCGDGR